MTASDLQDAHESKLRRFALRHCRDSDEADDLVQETFIRALGHLGLIEQLRPNQRQSWLFTTLRNLCQDRAIAQRRRDALHESATQSRPAFDDPRDGYWFPSPFDAVPEQFREVVELRYVQGLNSREIAERLNIPAATVRSRLHAAIKHLRKHKRQWE